MAEGRAMTSKDTGTLHKKRVTKEIVGHYTVTTRPCLSRGSFGTVCKAVHNITGELVVVKEILISCDGKRNPEMFQLANEELRILFRLNCHKNIVELFDYFVEQDTFWIFMEFCDLNDLKEYLQNNKNINALSKLKILQQCANGISFMHEQTPKIIHRDIKLENILLKRECNEHVVKITDFGLSKINTANRQSMSTLCGTEFYLAPELYLMLGKYDETVDIFALGLVSLVVFEFNPHHMELVPLSVTARKAKRKESVGTEMADCYKAKKPMPKVVKISPKDEVTTKQMKHVILLMTQFESSRRPSIRHVTNEIAEIIQTVEELAEIKIKVMRQKSKVSEETLALRTRVLAKRQAACNNPRTGEQKASSLRDQPAEKQLPAVDQLSRKSFKFSTMVELTSAPYALRRIGEELWSLEEQGISVYNSSLERMRTIGPGEPGVVKSVANLDGRQVVAATSSMLCLMTVEGRKVKTLDEGNFSDVCIHEHRIYASATSEHKSSTIQLYCAKSFKKIQTTKTQCYGLHVHTMGVNTHAMFLACADKNALSMFSLQGKLIQVYDKKGRSPGEFHCPFLCEVDSNGDIWVADVENNRLQVRLGHLWKVVQLDPQLLQPMGCVCLGGALYIASWKPLLTLSKYTI